MVHVASPSLISLGLTSDTFSERLPFRWGMVSSIFLHALVITMAMFVKFQTNNEQPFRTIDVALISLSTQSTTTPISSPANSKKSVAAQPPKKVAPPPPTPTAQPPEPTLPPLPTKTATERLSESLGGAINSIVVPQKREAPVSKTPSQEPTSHPIEDPTPLHGNLQLPSAAPTIARPKRLQPAEPLNIPSSSRPLIPAPEKTPMPLQSRPVPSPAPTAKPRPVVKPAPSIPSLSEVTPFTRAQQEPIPPETPRTSKIEESLKRNIQNIQTPTSTPNIPKISQERTTTSPVPKSSPPPLSAPKLATIPETQKPKASKPPQPKMSDTVRKLMEGLKATTGMPATKRVPLEQTNPSRTTIPSIKPPPSAIDQRIAKLSIPEVAPVESIKQRLQLLGTQTPESSGGSTDKPSPGKNRYLAMVEDRIDRQWVAPPLLTSNPVVVLNFHISRSGEISQIQIVESSGHSHYDSSAQRAVQSVNPLPPFPADISDSFFDVKYRFIKD